MHETPRVQDVGADGAGAAAGRQSPYDLYDDPLLSPAELDLRNREVDGAPIRLDAKTPRTGPDGVDFTPGKNLAYMIKYKDGSKAIYKPIAGGKQWRPEDVIARESMAVREVRFFRLSQDLKFEELGFEPVPTTTLWNGPFGLGSVQEWDDGVPGLPVLMRDMPGNQTALGDQADGDLGRDPYPEDQMDGMVVLDYGGGSTDRHTDGWRTTGSGDIVAHDNGLSGPRSQNTAIVSDFVALHIERGRPLGDSMVEHLRSLDYDHIRARQLSVDGSQSDPAVDLTMDRLGELRDRGRVTGESWAGGFKDSRYNDVDRPTFPDQGG